MACCVLAAFLVAQLVALLRRWGVFWGVVRPREYEDAGNTALAWVRGHLVNPRTRRVLGGLVVLEIALLGSWLYTVHGSHLYRLADIGVSSLRGERVIYVGVCTERSDDQFVRLVIDRTGRA